MVPLLLCKKSEATSGLPHGTKSEATSGLPHGTKSEASFGLPHETKSEASLVLPPLVAGGFQSPGESLKEK